MGTPRSGDRRSTSNKNVTGSAANRRRRKQWLLDTFGDGKTAPCMMDQHHPECPGTVDYTTVWVDRFPISGIDGGSYRRDNIRPAAPICNMSHGGKLGAARREANKRA